MNFFNDNFLFQPLSQFEANFLAFYLSNDNPMIDPFTLIFIRWWTIPGYILSFEWFCDFFYLFFGVWLIDATTFPNEHLLSDILNGLFPVIVNEKQALTKHIVSGILYDYVEFPSTCRKFCYAIITVISGLSLTAWSSDFPYTILNMFNEVMGYNCAFITCDKVSVFAHIYGKSGILGYLESCYALLLIVFYGAIALMTIFLFSVSYNLYKFVKSTLFFLYNDLDYIDHLTGELTIVDASITKFHLAAFFSVFFFALFLVFGFKNSKYYLRNWNVILFGKFDAFLSDTIVQQLGVKRGQKYSVFLKSVFYLILLGNICGLIPFSFTITSHLIYTFALSLAIWLGITLLAIVIQGVKFVKLFIPSGAPVLLLVLLVPIEIISYVARCFSLAIRLFANMMSGHTLLNILSGFVIKIGGSGYLLLALAPFAVVMAVTVLEVGIAFLQAYVFLVLVCIYLKDSFEGGH